MKYLILFLFVLALPAHADESVLVQTGLESNNKTFKAIMMENVMAEGIRAVDDAMNSTPEQNQKVIKEFCQQQLDEAIQSHKACTDKDICAGFYDIHAALRHYCALDDYGSCVSVEESTLTYDDPNGKLKKYLGHNPELHVCIDPPSKLKAVITQSTIHFAILEDGRFGYLSYARHSKKKGCDRNFYELVSDVTNAFEFNHTVYVAKRIPGVAGKPVMSELYKVNTTLNENLHMSAAISDMHLQISGLPIMRKSKAFIKTVAGEKELPIEGYDGAVPQNQKYCDDLEKKWPTPSPNPITPTRTTD